MQSQNKYSEKFYLFVVFLLVFCFFATSGYARYYPYGSVNEQVSLLLYDPLAGSAQDDLIRITEVYEPEPYYLPSCYMVWIIPCFTRSSQAFGFDMWGGGTGNPFENLFGYSSQGYDSFLLSSFLLSSLFPMGFGYTGSYGAYNGYENIYGNYTNQVYNPYYPSGTGNAVPPYQKRAVLKYEVAADKTAYEHEEPAVITLTITNEGNQAATLHFSSGKQFDIVILDEAGFVVWQMSKHLFYTLNIASFTIQPGEAKSFQCQWDQTNDQGGGIPGGVYTIEAFLASTNEDYQGIATTTMAIVDMVIDESADEQTIQLRQGNLVQVNLEANVTTGYQWQGEWDTSLISSYDHNYIGSPDGLIGSGGKDVWFLKALAAGETDVTFHYVRPWETGIDPVKEFTLHLVIDEAEKPGDGQSGGGILPPPSLSTLVCSVETDKVSYLADEAVNITFTASNTADEPLSLYFNSGRQFDVAVKDAADKLVWRLSDNQMYILSLADLELQPGETKSFQCQWDQKDSQGTAVLPGDYTIEGCLTAVNFSGQGSAKISLSDDVASTPSMNN